MRDGRERSRRTDVEMNDGRRRARRPVQPADKKKVDDVVPSRISRNRQVAGDTTGYDDGSPRGGGCATVCVVAGTRATARGARVGTRGVPSGPRGGFPSRGSVAARCRARAENPPPRDEKTFRTGEGSESSRPNREPTCAPDPGRGDARTHLYSRYPPGASSPARGARFPSSRTAPASSGRRASASRARLGWFFASAVG